MWLAEHAHYDDLIATMDMLYPGTHWKSIERFRMVDMSQNHGRRAASSRYAAARGVFELYAKLLSHKVSNPL